MSRDYDDDYGSNFEKFTHRKGKKGGKGHQSRSGRADKWNSVLADDDYGSYAPRKSTPQITPIEQQRKQIDHMYRPESAPQYQATGQTYQTVEHQFGENTHEIKGVKIDFDGVLNIEKVENERDGIMTYGIKFYFKGKKGLFRVIWFNVNSRLRDSIYNTEYAFWLKVQQGAQQ